MKQFKKVLLLFVIIGMILLTTSCKGKQQKFTSHGITVTLTTNYKETKMDNIQVCYLASKTGFMGNQESKKELLIGNNKLNSYTDKVLLYSNLSHITYQTYNKDDVIFNYAYYTATVNSLKYKYMLITKEGKEHYYTMNFWCFEDDFEQYEEQFMKWATKIEVE